MKITKENQLHVHIKYWITTIDWFDICRVTINVEIKTQYVQIWLQFFLYTNLPFTLQTNSIHTVAISLYFIFIYFTKIDTFIINVCAFIWDIIRSDLHIKEDRAMWSFLPLVQKLTWILKKITIHCKSLIFNTHANY